MFDTGHVGLIDRVTLPRIRGSSRIPSTRATEKDVVQRITYLGGKFSAWRECELEWAMESETQRVLIVEDDISDIRNAAAVLKKLGVSAVDAVNNVGSAIVRLQDAVDGLRPAPYLVMLDLDFARESGFEVLRFWKSHKSLKDMRIVVWTSMGDTQVELSRFFGVEVVRKGPGAKELEVALRSYFPIAEQR